MTTIRMSSLPALAQCPARFAECAGMPNVSGEPAVMGTIAHAVIGGYLEKKPADVAGLATVYGVDSGAVEDLADQFSWIGLNATGTAVETEIEVQIAELGLVGHFDVATRIGDVADIYDFKTGRVEVDPPDRNLQLIAYAIGYMEAHPELRRAHLHIYQPHCRGHEKAVFGRVMLGIWRDRIAEIVAAARAESPDYRPGDHCGLCDARAKCPALHMELSPILTDETVAVRFAELTPAKQSHVLAMTLAGRKVLDAILESAKVTARVNGPIPLGEGTEWGPREETHRSIDAARGWSALSYHCGTHLAEAVKVSLSAAEEAAVANEAEIVENPPRGWKGATKKALFKALADAGAIKQTTVEKFTARKTGGKEGIE